MLNITTTQKGEKTYNNIRVQDLEPNKPEKIKINQDDCYEREGQYGKFLSKRIIFNNKECSVIIPEYLKTTVFGTQLIDIFRELKQGVEIEIERFDKQAKNGRAFKAYEVRINGTRYVPQKPLGGQSQSSEQGLNVNSQDEQTIQQLLNHRRQNNNVVLKVEDVRENFPGKNDYWITQVLNSRINNQ